MARMPPASRSKDAGAYTWKRYVRSGRIFAVSQAYKELRAAARKFSRAVANLDAPIEPPSRRVKLKDFEWLSACTATREGRTDDVAFKIVQKPDRLKNVASNVNCTISSLRVSPRCQ